VTVVTVKELTAVRVTGEVTRELLEVLNPNAGVVSVDGVPAYQVVTVDNRSVTRVSGEVITNVLTVSSPPQLVTIGIPGPMGPQGPEGPEATPALHSPEFTYSGGLLTRVDYQDGTNAFKVLAYLPDGSLDYVELTRDGVTIRKTAVYGVGGELIALPQTTL
jgi:hypothetical protein